MRGGNRHGEFTVCRGRRATLAGVSEKRNSAGSRPPPCPAVHQSIETHQAGLQFAEFDRERIHLLAHFLFGLLRFCWVSVEMRLWMNGFWISTAYFIVTQ